MGTGRDEDEGGRGWGWAAKGENELIMLAQGEGPRNFALDDALPFSSSSIKLLLPSSSSFHFLPTIITMISSPPLNSN